MSASQDSGVSSPIGSPSVAPVLSFKKRRNKTPPPIQSTGFGANSAVNRPNASNNDSDARSANVTRTGTPTSVPTTPILGGNRKVSNRRKALQDFYKMNPAIANPGSSPIIDSGDSARGSPQITVNGEGMSVRDTDEHRGESIKSAEKSDENGDLESILRKLDNEDAVKAFIQTASAKEILRVRNAAANKLDYHDSERKSMIYNNYSELIKLNDVLSNVFQDTPANADFSPVEDENTVTNSSIDAYLADLSSFLESEASVFNQDFATVVESICSKIDGADSASSVTGIIGGS